MADKEQLSILKQGAKVWNKWRRRNPHIIPSFGKANLSQAYLHRADLSQADFLRADLSGADLSGAFLNGAFLIGANLSGADLSMARLRRAKLFSADLSGADLSEAYLCSADLWTAILEKANLYNTDLQYCQLVECDLTGAVLTGVKLYGTARDNWKIKDVKCKYVYWDQHGKQRSPKDRDLERGEFERLYAQPPTIEYVFEDGMTPIDPLIMDRIVEAIREKQPEFDIKIDSINARGLAPSIKFTVRYEEQKEEALAKVSEEFQIKQAKLEGKIETFREVINQLIERPPLGITTTGNSTTIRLEGEKHMGDNISIGGDNIGGAVGKGASVSAEDIYKVVENSTTIDEELREKLKESCKEIERLKLPKEHRDDVVKSLGELTEEMKKTEPDKGWVKELWERIEERAPTVAAILTTANILASFIN
jgi:uncharacterized protein YjbI with pentapeptide repeats